MKLYAQPEPLQPPEAPLFSCFFSQSCFRPIRQPRDCHSYRCTYRPELRPLFQRELFFPRYRLYSHHNRKQRSVCTENRKSKSAFCQHSKPFRWKSSCFTHKKRLLRSGKALFQATFCTYGQSHACIEYGSLASSRVPERGSITLTIIFTSDFGVKNTPSSEATAGANLLRKYS